ncbi:MAG TPA: sensor domain-containing diguanylate cyclase [Acidimicrobiales bacterium]|nr:sensor domain-containing diguanylate cyclase [Acidimicrobiales bacterium]
MGTGGNGDLPDAAFRTIVETLSIPILVIADDGTITYFGGSAQRDFRATKDEVVGRNIVEFLPPEHVEEAIASMADLVAHEQVGIGVPPVYPIVRLDGTVTWQAIGAVPLLSDPDVAGIAMYFMPWEAQLHLDDSLASLLAGDPLPQVLGTLTRAVAVSFESPGAAIHHGFRDGTFAGQAAWGMPEECLALPGSPWHEAAITGRPVFAAVQDLEQPHLRSAATAAGIEGIWAFPIIDEVLDPAVMTVCRDRPQVPVTAHDSVATRCLRYVQLTLVRSAEHEQLAHLASHDPLTGTGNRLRFREHLDRALESGGPTVLLFCDMDRFKAVNDELGHAAGDAVLVELVARLRTVLRPGDELARIGGDEFTILLRGDLDGARQVADRLTEVAGAPFEVGGTTVEVGLSVGIAAARPGEGADDLLRRADAALYAAKRQPDISIDVAP